MVAADGYGRVLIALLVGLVVATIVPWILGCGYGLPAPE